MFFCDGQETDLFETDLVVGLFACKAITRLTLLGH